MQILRLICCHSLPSPHGKMVIRIMTPSRRLFSGKNYEGARSYKAALSALDSCRKEQGMLKGRLPHGKRGHPSLYGMKEGLQLLGYQDADLDRLNAIHVAGTNGKGSTCVFTNCFLQAHGETAGFPQKIGLFTGPHLISIREKFRINSKPISEALFAKYFFEVWDKLPEKHRLGPVQILTLQAFHTFFREQVDVAIFETNSGGAYDATNVVKPNVVGITKLGVDHVRVLGSTIESIAWQKSGIFKPQIPAFSTLQCPAACHFHI